MRYLITFTCYGAHIHGDESGSVDRRRNVPNTRTVEADPDRAATERRIMEQEPYLLHGDRRAAVLAAMNEVCEFRRWRLFATHVRSNHVHVVVDGEPKSERILNDLKSYASRSLNRLGFDPPGKRALGTPRKHAMVVAIGRCAGRDSLRCRRARQPMSVFVADPELLPGNRPE